MVFELVMTYFFLGHFPFVKIFSSRDCEVPRFFSIEAQKMSIPYLILLQHPMEESKDMDEDDDEDAKGEAYMRNTLSQTTSLYTHYLVTLSCSLAPL